MPWGRFGDGTATYPVVLRGGSVAGADSRTRWELLGFAIALASVSAYHTTDYVVERGMVDLLGGMDADRLIKQMCEAGYLSETVVGGRPGWKLLNDPKFIHLRLKEEIEWDRQRKADNGRSDLTLEVQRRDGSACRRCGRSVSWSDRVGGRGATYDHLVKPARGPDDLTVACRSCNSSRGEPGSDQAETFDQTHPLLPVPAKPYFCDYLRARLAKHGIDVDPAPEAERLDNLSGDAPSEQRPTTGDTAHEADRSGTQPGHDPSSLRSSSEGHAQVKPGDLAAGVQKSTFPGRVGAGSGQVRDGPGGAGDGAPGRLPRRRARRGRRGRPNPNPGPTTTDQPPTRR